jgi:uncharacterized lipoprotein YddW (UPF0748 family)
MVFWKTGILAVVLAFGACSWRQRSDAFAASPPPPPREFRGTWIATVSNIDWPSKPGLSTDAQKSELIQLLDRAKNLKLNAVILQVRPACDAFYVSTIEPWSEYLTGRQGLAPDPGYDPLEFAVAAAHSRGLELHAWFNPFRAGHPSAKSPASSNHVSRRYPKLVKKYGSYLWLDPGEQVAQDYSTTVILDVVKRYDIDGVHLDDYFYPYQVANAKGGLIDFPDDASWDRYQAAHGTLERNDWRRENVNRFIRNLYIRIKKEKRWVKFGISPFGIWRPGNPPKIAGLDAYDHLYADSRKWILNGWADYFSPQLYWPIDSPGQSFPLLLDWWEAQNKQARHLWPGLNSHKTTENWAPTEIVNQVTTGRARSTGHIHWNGSSVLGTHEPLRSALNQTVYTRQALIPASPWLDKRLPPKPKAYLEERPDGRSLKVRWETKATDPAALWVLQSHQSGRWFTHIFPGAQTAAIFEAKASASLPDTVAVSLVNRYGTLSPIALLATPGK